MEFDGLEFRAVGTLGGATGVSRAGGGLTRMLEANFGSSWAHILKIHILRRATTLERSLTMASGLTDRVWCALELMRLVVPGGGG
jgi:hypothetical protein